MRNEGTTVLSGSIPHCRSAVSDVFSLRLTAENIDCAGLSLLGDEWQLNYGGSP
jgi:hypothetical protein